MRSSRASIRAVGTLVASAMASFPFSARATPPILDTDVHPPVAAPGDFAASICKNGEFLVNAQPAHEWVSVLPGADPIVGVSGVAVRIPDEGHGWDRCPYNLSVPLPANPPRSAISGADLTFVHPFGYDFEFFIAPDAPFRFLGGAGNGAGRDDAHIDGEYCKARHGAVNFGAPRDAPVLGVEIDQDLVPSDYRPQHGDRVAVFGTWIADCAHPTPAYHTEIHPPLLMASAEPRGTELTATRVVGRPFTTTQEFGDGALRQHLLNEVGKIHGIGCNPAQEFFVPGSPCSTQLEAHVQVSQVPFSGTQTMTYLIRPPSARRTVNDHLKIDYQLTVRSGVTVTVAEVAGDAVRVTVTMSEHAYKKAAFPPRHDGTTYLHEIAKENTGAGAALALIFGLSGHDPLLPITYGFMGRGIKYTRFAAPALAALPGGDQVIAVNDGQVFPIVGHIDVGWRRGLNTRHLPGAVTR